MHGIVLKTFSDKHESIFVTISHSTATDFDEAGMFDKDSLAAISRTMANFRR